MDWDTCTNIWIHRSNGSAVRVLTDGHTDTQTDGTDSITSTADAGGNNFQGSSMSVRNIAAFYACSKDINLMIAMQNSLFSWPIKKLLKRVSVKAGGIGGTGGSIRNAGGRFYTMNALFYCYHLMYFHLTCDAALVTSCTSCTSCYLLFLRIPFQKHVIWEILVFMYCIDSCLFINRK